MRLTIKEFEKQWGELYPDEVKHLKHNRCTSVITSDITGHALCGFYRRMSNEQIKAGMQRVC